MNTQAQIRILNSLITFAAENIPGGLNDEEQEVAQIVGRMATGPKQATRTHIYKEINPTTFAPRKPGSGSLIEQAANNYAEMGWRVVGVVSDTRSGHTHSLVLERPIGVSHPDD